MNITANVTRILKHYGLEKSVTITRADNDRCFGWGLDGRLLSFVIINNWNPDDRFTSKIHHGTQFSFREPGGVRPALQICFHSTKTGYFVELDFDYASPAGGFKSFFIHVGEVIGNFVTGAKTDQQKISKMLDKRGIA